MGAKFKAALDSRCFAQEQHFRLPLSLLRCLFILSFAVFPPSCSLLLCLFHGFFDSFHPPPLPLLILLNISILSRLSLPFSGPRPAVGSGSQQQGCGNDLDPGRGSPQKETQQISPGSRTPPLASESPWFLLRTRRFHNCSAPAICSLRGLQRLPLM